MKKKKRKTSRMERAAALAGGASLAAALLIKMRHERQGGRGATAERSAEQGIDLQAAAAAPLVSEEPEIDLHRQTEAAGEPAADERLVSEPSGLEKPASFEPAARSRRETPAEEWSRYLQQSAQSEQKLPLEPEPDDARSGEPPSEPAVRPYYAPVAGQRLPDAAWWSVPAPPIALKLREAACLSAPPTEQPLSSTPELEAAAALARAESEAAPFRLFASLPGTEQDSSKPPEAVPGQAVAPSVVIPEQAERPPYGVPWRALLSVVMAGAMLLVAHESWRQDLGCVPQDLGTSMLQLASYSEQNQPLLPVGAVAASQVATAAPAPSAAATPAAGAAGGQPGTEQALQAASGAATPVPSSRTPQHLLNGAAGLAHFYQAIDDLANHRRTAPVRIVHYGDSPTTADLITGDSRTHLQQLWGNAGHGFVLIDRPWAWYNHRDVQLVASGWTAEHAVGAAREGDYGLGGARFQGSAGARTRIRMVDTTHTSVDVSYAIRPGAGRLAVLADGKRLQTVDTSAGAAGPGFVQVDLPSGTAAVELRVESGTVVLYGVTLDKDAPGISYDSLGLNGASTVVLSRVFRSSHWAAQLQHRNPDLVIINYGTNESGYLNWIDKQYETELRLAIGRVRAALPEASILIVSPMDRGERRGGKIVTVEGIKQIVAIQQRVALDTGCGFFNTFEAMGGEFTMQRWYDGPQRMVAADLIHPSPQGARMISDLFVGELTADLERTLHKTPTQSSAVPSGSAEPHAGGTH